jgi:type III pantothenate kinase
VKLLVDMGNSRMKWATVSGGALSQVNLLAYDDFISQLSSLWQSMDKPEQIVVSCVSEERYWQELGQLVKTFWGKTVQRIESPGQGYGVVNAYRQPRQLGSDRWAALVAAHAIYATDVCIVDCGTALTIDMLSADGQHQGGVIVPGARIMQDSLLTNTAAISQSIEPAPDDSGKVFWGQDTQSGIIKGSWLALAGAVEKVIVENVKRQSAGVTCVLCGGDAGQLSEYLSMDVVLEPELVLKGLAVIAGEEITA